MSFGADLDACLVKAWDIWFGSRKYYTMWAWHSFEFRINLKQTGFDKKDKLKMQNAVLTLSNIYEVQINQSSLSRFD